LKIIKHLPKKNLNQKVINEGEASMDQYKNFITSLITLMDGEAFSAKKRKFDSKPIKSRIRCVTHIEKPAEMGLKRLSSNLKIGP
jgi:hypothetical protein